MELSTSQFHGLYVVTDVRWLLMADTEIGRRTLGAEVWLKEKDTSPSQYTDLDSSCGGIEG